MYNFTKTIGFTSSFFGAAGLIYYYLRTKGTTGATGATVTTNATGYFFNKNEKPQQSYALKDVSVYNLTPHNINLYNSDKKLLFSIKPEDPKMQLRLSSNKNTESEKHVVLSNNYILENTSVEDMQKKNI